MPLDLPAVHVCPICGEECAIIYGCGWDYDFIFCPCGYEKVLETSTEFNYAE